MCHILKGRSRWRVHSPASLKKRIWKDCGGVDQITPFLFMSSVNASRPDPVQWDNLCINTIRFLSVEAVEKANSGHPKPAARLTNDVVKASDILLRLGEAGIDLDMTTQQLEDEGVQKFIKAFDILMNTLKEKQSQTLKRPKTEQTGK
ncbi:MAG TPA: hypothetical protein VFC44_21675 [Candidatus Saccharimonadales bacterium]|nr:hypothetical protein [Candidatus Saccharimonadales bacterium]